MLTIEELTSELLPGISFTAKPGECICIHGESGSGKTLLLRAIADLDPNQGKITLNSQSRDDLPANEWRRKVTYLPAESHWWSDNVIDHFTASPVDFSSLGLPGEIGNWKISHLSSGEKQRLALLRSLQHKPQVLLLDEATANLDEQNTQRVEQLITEKLHAGLTVIWVSHDKKQRQRMANKSYMMRNGRFVEAA